MADLLKTTVDGTLTINNNSSNTSIISTDNTSPQVFPNATTINAFNGFKKASIGSDKTLFKSQEPTIDLSSHTYNTISGRTISKICFYSATTEKGSIKTKFDSNYHVYYEINLNNQNLLEIGKDGQKAVSNSSVRIKNLTISNYNSSTDSEVRINTTGTNPYTELNGTLVVYGESLNSAEALPSSLPIENGAVVVLQAGGVLASNSGIKIKSYSQTISLGNNVYGYPTWSIFCDNGDNLSFYLHTTRRGYIDKNVSSETSMTFTGQHRCSVLSDEIETYKNNIGKIVVSTGNYRNLLEFNNIEIDEALPIVELSSQRKQKNVFGVISDSENIEDTTRSYVVGVFGSDAAKNPSLQDTKIIINSVGEGGIWICNINGVLKNGDLITTCEVPGFGMKQDSRLFCNYTVAKITCDCEFDLNSEIYICEEFEWEGQILRRAFVGCTYHCG